MSQTTIVVAENAPAEGAAAETPAVEAPAAGETGQTTESTAHEGGHKGPFPPMDATTYPSQIFWLVIFFGLLYLLMSKVALPKMAQVLGNRHKAIEGDLAKASAAKNETEAAVQAYVDHAQHKADRERIANTEKTGVFTGAYAINPVNGQALRAGDALKIEGESALRLCDGRQAEVLVFDLAP